METVTLLHAWAEGLLHLQRMTIRAPITVTGVYDRHLGPRWNYAYIKVIAEPSEQVEVSLEVPLEKGLTEAILREAIFGMLDTLMTQPGLPVVNLRLRVVGAVLDPVRSTQHAFRLAGRLAAKELLATAELVPPSSATDQNRSQT